VAVIPRGMIDLLTKCFSEIRFPVRSPLPRSPKHIASLCVCGRGSLAGWFCLHVPVAIQNIEIRRMPVCCWEDSRRKRVSRAGLGSNAFDHKTGFRGVRNALLHDGFLRKSIKVPFVCTRSEYCQIAVHTIANDCAPLIGCRALEYVCAYLRAGKSAECAAIDLNAQDIMPCAATIRIRSQGSGIPVVILTGADFKGLANLAKIVQARYTS